jgi:hypothetical protein
LNDINSSPILVRKAMGSRVRSVPDAPDRFSAARPLREMAALLEVRGDPFRSRRLAALDRLRSTLSPGVLELLQVPTLSLKKADQGPAAAFQEAVRP